MQLKPNIPFEEPPDNFFLRFGSASPVTVKIRQLWDGKCYERFAKMEKLGPYTSATPFARLLTSNIPVFISKLIDTC